MGLKYLAASLPSFLNPVDYMEALELLYNETGSKLAGRLQSQVFQTTDICLIPVNYINHIDAAWIRDQMLYRKGNLLSEK